MKKFNLKTGFLLLFSVFIMLSACEEEDSTPIIIDPNDTTVVNGPYYNGVLITNEGTFGLGNGSLSFYSYEKDSLSNNIFSATNDRALGDVVQSVTIQDTLAFIVVNASNKVEVVINEYCSEYKVINNLISPRYYHAIDSTKGYVSQWGENGAVKVIDLKTFTVSKTIATGAGSEQMLLHNNFVYVANSGGYGNNNTVSVIDANTDEVVKTIVLDGDSPRDLALDANGYIWVICAGYVDWSNYPAYTETTSKLIKINPDNNSVVASIAIGESYHPTCIETNKDKTHLIYGGGFGVQGVYKMAIDESTPPSSPLINKYIYGFNVSPKTGNIFATEAPTYTSNGTLYRFDENGTELGSYEAGIGPNGAGFKKK